MIAYRIQNDIELVRELSGMTIQEIAGRTGMFRMTVDRWIHGDRHVSYEKAECIFAVGYV